MKADKLNERRKKGLYFHCNDKYSPGHSCMKLFMIEASWEKEDNDVVMEIEEDGPEISLRAIAGLQAPKTMRIWGGLKGQAVLLLWIQGVGCITVDCYYVGNVISIKFRNVQKCFHPFSFPSFSGPLFLNNQLLPILAYMCKCSMMVRIRFFEQKQSKLF